MPGIGRPGPPGSFDGLNDFDLSRIAAWPGVKVKFFKLKQKSLKCTLLIK